jgi:hypothetical protein
MGRVRTSRRKTCAKKEYKKAFKTDNRARDVDQIQEVFTSLFVSMILSIGLYEIQNFSGLHLKLYYTIMTT